MKRWKMSILAALVLAMLAGCAQGPTLDQAKQAMAQLDAAVTVANQQAAELRAQKAAIQAVIATMPDGAEKDRAMELLEKVDGSLARVQLFLQQATPVLAQANAEIQAATDGLAAAQAAATAAASLAPQPWGGIALLGIPLIFAILRAVRNKKAALAVAASVNEVVAAALAEHPKLAARLNVEQGAAGKAIVDQAQGAWGLPI